MSGALVRRILVAAVAIPLTFGLVVVGGWLLVGGLSTLAVVGTSEFYAMARKHGVDPLASMGYVGALIIPVFVYAHVEALGWPLWTVGALLTWFMLVQTVAVLTRSPAPDTIASVSVTVFGPVYASGLLSSILFLRHAPAHLTALGASWLVFFPLVTTWVCDSLAMAGGALIGGRKLAPVVSPNKTWSGAIVGLMGAAVTAVLFGRFVLEQFRISLAPVQLLLIGAAVGIVGQVGDLAESLFKRSAGVKDSGRFFGEHGGVLDRLDSLYWVLPISTLLLMAFGVL
jgi:phosphatidate cytidylyltransferase